MRHSAAHLMAAAVSTLCGRAKFGVGPAIKHGFYYVLWRYRSGRQTERSKEDARAAQQKKLFMSPGSCRR